MIKIPHPVGQGRVDDLPCRAVHFYGPMLHRPLAAAAAYLQQLEQQHGKSPHVLCLSDEFSPEDDGSELAWRITLVLSECPDEGLLTGVGGLPAAQQA